MRSTRQLRGVRTRRMSSAARRAPIVAGGVVRTRTAEPAVVSRRQLVALVLLFVVTGLIFIRLDQGQLLDSLKGPVERPVRVAGGAFTEAGVRVRAVGDRFGNVEELSAENRWLLEENQRLRADQARVRELERDNAQLVEQAKIASLFPQYQQQPARVVGRDDPRTREKMLVIDRGAEDGIEVGMPVLSPSFLIGLVTEVYPRSAKVRLIIDDKSTIGVQLQEERAYGIVYGMWQRGGRLTMKHIERSVPLAPDPANPPRVVTALGMTARVPPGLLVGYVTSVKKNDQADQQQAEVVPYVSNFDGLELVTVLLTGDR